MNMPPRAPVRLVFLRPVICAALLGWAGPGHAADSGPAPANDKLASARAQIKARQWPAALEELKRVDDGASADWNNLMGYTLRKGNPPDLAGAEKHYAEALRLDPKHRGALEYSGELYLIKGDLPAAEQRLATLNQVCWLPCEEYTDLKKSVARYKANDNKYVAAP